MNFGALASSCLFLLVVALVADADTKGGNGCWMGPPSLGPQQQQPQQEPLQGQKQPQQPAFVPTISKTAQQPPTQQQRDDSEDGSKRTTVFPEFKPSARQGPRPPRPPQPNPRRPQPSVQGPPLVPFVQYPVQDEQETERPDGAFLNPQRGPNNQQPYPVYDRSGFRREPNHPSFGAQPGTHPPPTLVPSYQTTPMPSLYTGYVGGDSKSRGNRREQPAKGRPQPGQQDEPRFRPRAQSTDQSREDATASLSPTVPTPRFDSRFDNGPISTVFYDPTRRPKSKTNTAARPSYDQEQTAQTAFPGQTTTRLPNQPTTEDPSQSREQTTPVKQGIADRGSFDVRRVEAPRSQANRDREGDSEEQTVPEYAFVKQPISKVLDKPDLELEGKPVSFSIMKDALYRVNLLELVSGPGPVTLFTPTDEAFLSLPADTLLRLQRNPQYLRTTMLRHIVDFDIPPGSLKNNVIIPSFSGEPLIMNVALGGKLMLVRGIPILAGTSTSNGVIYVINKVLIESSSSGTVLEELEKRPELSIFYGLIQRTQLFNRLQGQGPFTVLAPNNSAFENLSPVSRQVIEYNPSALERLLASHVIDGALYSKELESTPSLPSSSKEPLKLQSSPEGAISIQDGPSITSTDITTGNGVLHLTDGIVFPRELLITFKQLEARSFFNRQPVLTAEQRLRPQFGFTRVQSANEQLVSPPQRPQPDQRLQAVERPVTRSQQSSLQQAAPVPQALTQPERKEKFYTWLEQSRFLTQINQSPENYTVVLPTDKAIEKLPAKYLQGLEANSRKLHALLMYHVIPGSVDINRLSDEDTILTVSGKEIRFNKYERKESNDTILTLSGAPVLGERSENNGKVRFVIVDRVLYPPQGSIYDVISRSPILRSLSNLVKRANLQTELSASGPFTLFAPSDEAFGKLSKESVAYLSQNAESSRAFLLRHIVRPLIYTSSVPIGNSSDIESTAGERLTINREAESVKVDGVGITYSDITATNGVVHVVDHVL